jgi:hypothetical protein
MNVSPKKESPDTKSAKDPKDQKNQKQVLLAGVLIIVVVGCLGFVLVQNGVIPLGKNDSTAVATTSAPSSEVPPGSAPQGAAVPGGVRPGASMSKPGHPGMPGHTPAGSSAAMKNKAMPGHGPVGAHAAPKGAPHPPVKVASALGGAPGSPNAAAAGVLVYPHVGVRPDPFAPYANTALAKWHREHGFNVVEIPPVIYSGRNDGGPLPTPNGGPGNRYPGQFGSGQDNLGRTPVASVSIMIPWKVAGIMTGAGVKAILVNGEQSAIVQPGDDLPDDLAKVIKITSSTVVVRPVADASQEIVLDTNTAGSSQNSPYGSNNGGSRNTMPPNMMNRGMQRPNNRFNPTQNRYNTPNPTQYGMD